MKKNNKSEAIILRNKAEELLKNRPLKSASLLPEADMLKLMHELEVYQIELELQQEELMLAKEQAAAVENDKLTDLYDFAQIGYFTLSKEGKIIELNVCGSKMLHKEGAHLKNSSFALFISDKTKPIFNHFLSKIFDCNTKKTCEVTLLPDNNLSMDVRLSGIATQNGEQCLLTALELTRHKHAVEEH